MLGSIDIVVLDDGSADRELVRRLLASDPGLRLVDYFGGVGQHMPAADVVLVVCAEYGPAADGLIRDAVSERPTRPVVLLTHGEPNGSVDSAVAAGATDMLFLPRSCDAAMAGALGPQIHFTLEKAVASRRSAAGHDGRMIVLLGPKGGSGKTLVATNLAAALAEMGKRVAIVDADLQFGDVGLALGLDPETTIYDLVGSGGSLDPDKLDAFLVEHASGVHALLAPRRPDQAGLVAPDFLREVYAVLRSSYEYVIVDTPPSFSPEVIGAIDASSDVCVVGMLDALSLKNTRLGIETLSLMDYPERNVRFVLNRADSQVGISLVDVETIIGRSPDVMVPSDRQVTCSINAGEPIVLASPGCGAALAFRELAALYVEGRPPARKRRRRLHFSLSS